MDIYLKPEVRNQMRDQQVSCLLGGRIVSKGTRGEHPSGATMFTHKGMTLVGTWNDGQFQAFRFYKN